MFSHGTGNDAQFAHEFFELLAVESLSAVANGVIRIVVYFDEQSIGSCRYGGTRQGRNLVADPDRMAGIHHYGQMT